MNLEFSSRFFAKIVARRLLVGFSGGADSTAALLLTWQNRALHRAEVVAVHFNHHLRGAESDAEAAAAERFAAERGIPFQLVDLAVAPGENLESAARAARLRAWRTLTRPGDAAVLGHHAGDRAENLLLRLCRGANASGLSSMRAVAQVEGVTLLRPLLEYSRAEIEAYLRDAGVSVWTHDSSNSDNTVLRNYLRNILLPGLYARAPAARAGLLRCLEVLESDARFIEEYAEALPGDRNDAGFWRAQPPAVQIRLLRQLTGVIPSAETLTRLRHELAADSPEPRRIPVGGGVELRLQHGRVERVAPPPESGLWEWRKQPEWTLGAWHFAAAPATQVEKSPPDVAFFDADLLPEVLEIGPARPGERMTPFGDDREKKLKKLRADRKLPAAPALPVVRSRQLVYWAAGVRHSALAQVSAATCKIIKLTFTFQEDKWN